MRLKLEFRALAILLLVPGLAVAEGDVLLLDQISEEQCAPFSDPDANAPAGLADRPEDVALLGLLFDAIQRGCAAIGAAPLPGRPGEQGVRSTTGLPEEDEVKRLQAEAQYLVDTAMQIDADAANALLRRLLGPKPGEDG